MKKLLAICSILFTVCAFTSCGSDDNTYNTDNDGNVAATERADDRTDREKRDARDDNDVYDNNNDDNINGSRPQNATGRGNSAGNYVDDAIDGIGDAGEEIVDGVGDAAEDIVDGFDGEPDTRDDENHENND